ncbi:MAG: glutathione synthase [Omnitrophica WOR_2 bacterium RIFCSPHIGHO2_01_FULL_48_9]|nr:MAG: glutathione synthase [Omnitrophica WOR_2 bacterium RIFCSPHIGHO2_02_FULL_48_11]OGX30497.1 MAG: glutathione synthase [Omnitrophica WOR_2 bacterium RIFCSPHIGHO2_01_FULL_48_9]
MNFIFLMDPLETVIMEKDTTFILMLGAHRKGHKIFYLPDGGITLREGQLFFDTIPVVPQQNKEQPFIEKEEVILCEDEIDAIFIRNDPPFDQQYLINTWFLDKLTRRMPIINSPHGIRTVNEKIWVTQFTSLIPRTMISRQKEDLLDFLKTEKHVIAKPTDGYGGQSVFQIKQGDTNTHVILETLTARWSRDIILQQYIPQSQQGDKRILLLDGEPLGAVLRVHSAEDHRNNFFAGGKPHPAAITDRDREIIEEIKPQLQRLGLYFVGIDIIGDYLIEVNVTSPTCLQEMNQLYNKHLENDVIEFVEQLIKD